MPEVALDAALDRAFSHELPFVPELPGRGPKGFMIAAALDGLPGVTVDGGGRCALDAAVLHASLPRLEAHLRAAESGELHGWLPSDDAMPGLRPFCARLARGTEVAKVQLAGPCTVRAFVEVRGGVWPDGVLERFLAARAAALAAALSAAGVVPLVVLDEPGLGGLERAPARLSAALDAIDAVLAPLAAAGGLTGVHCCANTDWSRVLGLKIDVISLDARHSLDALLEDVAAWHRFVQRGGVPILGVVPTEPRASYRLNDLVDAVEASLRGTALPGVPFEATLAHALVSPACGLAGHSIDDANRIGSELRTAQRRLRRLLDATSLTVTA